MDKILELIYKKFAEELRDLHIGHFLEDSDICGIWELIHVYEMLNSNTLSLSEQKAILDYYD